MGGCALLDQLMTHQQFADLVGVSRQAVSDMQKRGVLRSGVTGAAWLQAYCEHLRSARQSGALADERAHLDRARREEVEMRNAARRKELVPAPVVRLVLAKIGNRMARYLGELKLSIRECWPTATVDQMAHTDALIERVCALAVGMSPDVLSEPDENEDVSE